MSNLFHYAVVIGINDYPAPELPNLKHSISDATAFHQWLTHPDGGDLPKENAILIRLPEDQNGKTLNLDNAIPNKSIVQRKILSVMQAAETAYDEDEEIWNDTRFYFYVSGHGFAPDSDEAALLMANAGEDFYGENLGTQHLMKYLKKRQPFKEIVMFSDCCRDRSFDAPVGGVSFNLEDNDKGITKSMTGFATSFGLKAFEPNDPAANLSHFTKILIEGLNGAALQSDEKELTCVKLEQYINNQFRVLNQSNPLNQSPDIDSNGGDPIILCRPKVSSTNVVLTFPEGFQEEVQIQDGSFKLITSIPPHKTQEGPWHLNLTMGLYKLVKAADQSSLTLQSSGIFQIQTEEAQHEFLH